MSATDSPVSLDGATDGSAPFGSALSVNEFAALTRADVAPLGAVMGCDLQSVSVALPTPVRPPTHGQSSKTYGRRYDNDVVEIEQLNALVGDSRRAALSHLRDEAAALGADAVFGIRQVLSTASGNLWSELAAHHRRGRRLSRGCRVTLDHQFVGTAVRGPALGSDGPCLTSLSATEFGKLRDAGWQPAGLVAGCSHQLGANIRPGYNAAEIEGATALWADARSRAFGQARAELTTLGGQGLIGLEIDEEQANFEHGSSSTSAWSALLVSVNLIATAIRRAPAAAIDQSPMKILTLR